jgi:hypothetical protein
MTVQNLVSRGRCVRRNAFIGSRAGVGSMRNLWAIVALAITSSALAETPADKALKACLFDALTNYTKAKLAFDASRGATPMQQTIDYYMARRRLEEGYCVQYSHCVVASAHIPENFVDMVAGVEFAKCLDDEAAERAELAK